MQNEQPPVIQVRLAELIDENHELWENNDTGSDYAPLAGHKWHDIRLDKQFPYNTDFVERLATVAGSDSAGRHRYLIVRHGPDYEADDDHAVCINGASYAGVSFPSLELAVWVKEQVNKYGKDAVPHRQQVNAGGVFASNSHKLWYYVMKELDKSGVVATAKQLAELD